MIEHPHRSGRLPVLALAEDGLAEVEAAAGEGSRPTLYLDRTARDALGISDGEFCLAHPWSRPRRAVWRRLLRDQLVGSRAISANVRTSARADLEKPVCRLDEETLAAIGGRASEFVTLEALRRDPGREDEAHWRRELMSQRVLPIDTGERTRRHSWEAAQHWDDGSISPARWSARRQAGVEHEGFVDCAETLGVHPAYPTVYLNFNARRELGVELCQPVEIRVNVFSRLLTEIGNLAWLVLIGLIGTVAALLEVPIGLIAVLLSLTLLALLTIRAMRSVR